MKVMPVEEAVVARKVVIVPAAAVRFVEETFVEETEAE